MDEIDEILDKAEKRKQELQAIKTWWKRWFKIFLVVLGIIIPLQLGVLLMLRVYGVI
jgi:hypothetical protein